MKRPTLDDVAKRAGVSRATVSRVVNGYPYVSRKVRERVLRAIEEIGYQPHITARALASRRTWNVGFVVPSSLHKFFTDPYFPRLIDGIVRVCNQHNYILSLFVFHTEDLEKQLLPRLTSGSLVDGIIIQATEANDTILAKIVQEGIPFVVVGRPLNLSDVSYVDVDNVGGAYKAVSHLIAVGRRHIGTITGPLNTAVGQDRLEGYRQALREHDLPILDRFIVAGDFTELSGYVGARRLLAQNPELDAIFVASDLMASGALRALREAGKEVPTDVALVGYDDLPPAQLAVPPLTTIRQPIQHLGMTAMQLLLEKVEHGETAPRKIVLKTELIVRRSCGALAQVEQSRTVVGE